MAPKKGKKMDLGAFLADEATGGSWADEMDALPTGPSGERDAAGGLGGSHLSRQAGGFGDRSGRSGAGEFMDRAPRAEVPMPTAPPFTAYVGNLTFETVEADIEDFFTGMPTSSIRLVSGPDNKPKGFGYVEFTSLDSLKSALNLAGTELNGRTLRISVAEPPKGREGRADEDMTWDRKGPLAPLAGGAGGRSGGFDRPRQDGFGSSAGAPDGAERSFEGPIRGGRFVPSAPGPERRAAGGGGGGGFDRPRREEGGFVPGAQVGEEVEREGPIRGGKFQPSLPAPERERSSFGGERRAAGSGPADEERSWTRQGPLAPLAGAGAGGRPGGAFGAAQRTPSFGEGGRAPESDGTPQPQRQRLQLAPRTPLAPSSSTSTPTSTSTSTSTPSSSTRPSPFGAAKPVDQAEREAAIEAKHAADRLATQARLALEKEKREAAPASAAAAAAAVVAEAETATASVKKGPSPFGEAKPVDVTQKEKEVEEKFEKARLELAAKVKEGPTIKRGESFTKSEPAAVAASTLASTPAVAAGATSPGITKAAMRKEGFSYSKAAVASSTTVADVTEKVQETKI